MLVVEQGAKSKVKRVVTSMYKFGLAFENTRETDYITEKLFQVLMVSVIAIDV